MPARLLALRTLSFRIIYANPITENVETLPKVLYYDDIEFDIHILSSLERYGDPNVYGRTSE